VLLLSQIILSHGQQHALVRFKAEKQSEVLNVSRNKTTTFGAKGASCKDEFLKDMNANVDDLGESDFDLLQGDDSDAEKKGGHQDLDTLFGQKKKKPDTAPAEGKPDAKLGQAPAEGKPGAKLGPFDSLLETLSTIDKAASDKTLKDKVIKLKALLAKDEGAFQSIALNLHKVKDKHEFEQVTTTLQRIEGQASALADLIHGKKANKEMVKKYMFDGIKLIKANKDLKTKLTKYCKTNSTE
jgi:hypothetical protein